MSAPGSEHSMIVSARDVAVGYGRHVVLRGVNWTVHRGERWFIVGPNGGGKSTLLKAVLGLLKPQAGDIARDPGGAMLPRHIGFVPQRCELNPTLPTTVREFVALGAVGLHVSAAERRERLHWALDRVHLGHRVDADYWSLSGGQRQRALLARALIRRPMTLVLDEPTSGLDPMATEALMSVLVELNRESELTILFVTHDVALARRYASHVIAVHEGTADAGPRDEILSEQRLAQMYGAAAAAE